VNDFGITFVEIIERISVRIIVFVVFILSPRLPFKVQGLGQKSLVKSLKNERKIDQILGCVEHFDRARNHYLGLPIEGLFHVR
jgi:hypothetical protein